MKNYKKFISNLKTKKLPKKIKRTTLITRKFLGNTFLVYNGIKFKKVFVNPYRLNTKFGEYSFTRTFSGHFKKKKK